MAHTYTVNGREYTVWDSCRTMLLVIELFQDDDFTPSEKCDLLIQMVFADKSQIPDDPETFAEALSCILWDACGIDLRGDHDTAGEKVFDWEQDAGRITASLRMAYGLDWDECSENMTFAEVCDLLAMLIESDSKTPFQEAVYYRSAEQPRRDRHNAEFVESWLRRREHFRLKPDGKAESREATTASNNDALEQLWRSAVNG